MAWVTQSLLESERGYTPGQIKARIQRQHWRPGIEWARIDGTRLYDLEAIDSRAGEIARSQRIPETTNSRRVVRLV